MKKIKHHLFKFLTVIQLSLLSFAANADGISAIDKAGEVILALLQGHFVAIATILLVWAGFLWFKRDNRGGALWVLGGLIVLGIIAFGTEDLLGIIKSITG
jgi:hypothetical protein